MFEPKFDSRPADEQAENYAHYLVPAVGEVWAGDVVQVAKPRPGDVILDVACGTGMITFRLARMVGDTGRVVGVESDSSLLAIAQRIKNALSVRNVSLRDGEYTSLPYGDGVFDRVVCFREIAFNRDRPALLKEMYRVLSRGGRLVLMAHGTRKGNPMEMALADAFRQHLGMEPAFFTKLFSLGELAGMELMLLDTGLRAHSITERVSHTSSFASFDGFWHGMVLGRSLSQMYNTLSRPTQEAIRAEAFSRLAPFRDPKGAGYTIPIEAVVATVLKP